MKHLKETKSKLKLLQQNAKQSITALVESELKGLKMKEGANEFGSNDEADDDGDNAESPDSGRKSDKILVSKKRSTSKGRKGKKSISQAIIKEMKNKLANTQKTKMLTKQKYKF